MIASELPIQIQQLTEYDYEAVERYLESPIPTQLDHTFSHLCQLYRQADEGSRRAASQSLNENRAAWLNVFAYRMSMLAVRQQSVQLLNDALTALLVIAHWDDKHNFMMTLAIAYHSEVKLGNPDLLFRSAARYACDDESSKLFLGFLERTPQDQRIEIMGFQEIWGSNGVIYMFANHSIPSGWK